MKGRYCMEALYIEFSDNEKTIINTKYIKSWFPVGKITINKNGKVKEDYVISIVFQGFYSQKINCLLSYFNRKEFKDDSKKLRKIIKYQGENKNYNQKEFQENEFIKYSRINRKLWLWKATENENNENFDLDKFMLGSIKYIFLEEYIMKENLFEIIKRKIVGIKEM